MQYKTLSELKKIIKLFETNNIDSNKISSMLVNDTTSKGLYMNLRQNKQGFSKTFIFRYKVNNKVYSITLNSFLVDNDLSEARQKVKEYKAILQSKEYKEFKENKTSGISLKDYLQYKEKQNKNITFIDVFNKWIASKTIREVTKQNYINTLKSFINVFGKRSIHDINKSDIIEFLASYQAKNKFAFSYAIFTLIKQIFNYCVAYDYLEFNVCDRIKYNILFKKPQTTHHKIIKEKELKEYIEHNDKAINNDGTTQNNKRKMYKALEFKLFSLMYKFNLYMPLRVKNILELEWSEVDFNKRMLVIPADKMKIGKEFKLPLNSQALELLEFMYKIKCDSYVFSYALSDKVRHKKQLYKALKKYQEKKLNNENLTRAIKELAKGYNIPLQTFRSAISARLKNQDNANNYINKLKKEIEKAKNKTISYIVYKRFLKDNKLNTPHRIRATFSTTLYNLTPLHKLDFTIIEMCLAHSVGNMVIKSYNHSERLKERSELMQFWGDYLDNLANDNALKKVSSSNDLFLFDSANRNNIKYFITDDDLDF